MRFGMEGCGPQSRGGWFAMRMGGGGRGFGGHGFGRGMDGGGGRRRMFDTGELRLVLLKLIAEQPRHGYDLIRAIEELTGGAYAPSPGVIYPTVTLLADMGLIDEQASEGARKLFAITAEGAAHLAERAAEVDDLMARLAALAAMQAKTDGAPIRRAMQNLKSVLQHRLSRDDVSTETLHEVAALIDAAAQKIERL